MSRHRRPSSRSRRRRGEAATSGRLAQTARWGIAFRLANFISTRSAVPACATAVQLWSVPAPSPGMPLRSPPNLRGHLLSVTANVASRTRGSRRVRQRAARPCKATYLRFPLDPLMAEPLATSAELPAAGRRPAACLASLQGPAPEHPDGRLAFGGIPDAWRNGPTTFF